MVGTAGLHYPEPSNSTPASEGRYRIEMQPPEGDAFYLIGEVREVDPPARLAYTFIWEDPDPDDVETLGCVCRSWTSANRRRSPSLRAHSRPRRAVGFTVPVGRTASTSWSTYWPWEIEAAPESPLLDFARSRSWPVPSRAWTRAKFEPGSISCSTVPRSTGTRRTANLRAVLDYYAVPLLVATEDAAQPLIAEDDVIGFAGQQVEGMRATSVDRIESNCLRNHCVEFTCRPLE